MHSFSHLSTWWTVYRNISLGLSFATANASCCQRTTELSRTILAAFQCGKQIPKIESNAEYFIFQPEQGSEAGVEMQAVVHETSPPACCKVIFLQSKYTYIQFPHLFSGRF